MATGITINGDGTATWTITAADTATLPLGKVAGTLTLWPGLPGMADLYAYWPLDETTGTRAKTLGSAASADLLESGGAVASAAGYFSRAASSTQADTSSLAATITPVDWSGGFTLAIRFNKSGAVPDAFIGKNLITFGTGVFTTAPGLVVASYRNSDSFETFMVWHWTGGTPDGIAYLAPNVETFTVDAWHLLFLWYDPAAGTFNSQIDSGAIRSASIAAANGALFTAIDTMNVSGKLSGNFTNWAGLIDTALLWPRALSPVERALLLGYPPASPTTISGLLDVLDSTTASTGPSTWTDAASGWSIALAEASATQGQAFSTVLTVTDENGDFVDLTGFYAKMDVTYDPQGSISKLQFIRPAHIIIAGHIYYTDYASGTSPRPTPIWPGVTVALLDNTNASLGTAVTDATGAYSFTDVAADQQEVHIQVALQMPSGEAVNQTGTSAAVTAEYGIAYIDLTCDRAPI